LPKSAVRGLRQSPGARIRERLASAKAPSRTRTACASFLLIVPVAQLPPHRRLSNFLGPKACAGLLDYVTAQSVTLASSTVQDWDTGKSLFNDRIRQSLTTRKLGDFDDLLLRRIAETVPGVRQDLGLPDFSLHHVELELAAHGDGGHYDFHTDTVHENQTGRIMSAVYYFFAEPKRFSGGELRLFGWWRDWAAGKHPNPHLDIAPENDSLLIFPSWALHEVMPVVCPSGKFADSRFSVNCWIWRTLPAEV
jgi:SM-20-related protein